MEVKNYQNLNLDYLELMTDGDADMKKMMLDILFEELPQEIDLLSTHYTSENWDDLKSIAHKLKSTLTFIGNDQMTVANNQIEHNATHMVDTEDISVLIDEVKEMFPVVMEELKEYYRRL